MPDTTSPKKRARQLSSPELDVDGIAATAVTTDDPSPAKVHRTNEPESEPAVAVSSESPTASSAAILQAVVRAVQPSGLEQEIADGSPPDESVGLLTGFTVLHCDCGRPARMKEVTRGLPHNIGQWFGVCGVDSCQYKRWADGSAFGGSEAQVRFNEYEDARLSLDNNPAEEEVDAAYQEADGDEDFGDVEERDFVDDPNDDMTEAQYEAMQREQWAEDLEKELGSDYDSEDMSESDFKDWQREQAQEEEMMAEAEKEEWEEQVRTGRYYLY